MVTKLRKSRIFLWVLLIIPTFCFSYFFSFFMYNNMLSNYHYDYNYYMNEYDLITLSIFILVAVISFLMIFFIMDIKPNRIYFEFYFLPLIIFILLYFNHKFDLLFMDLYLFYLQYVVSMNSGDLVFGSFLFFVFLFTYIIMLNILYLLKTIAQRLFFYKSCIYKFIRFISSNEKARKNIAVRILIIAFATTPVILILGHNIINNLLILWVAMGICLYLLCCKGSIGDQFEKITVMTKKLAQDGQIKENPLSEKNVFYETAQYLAKTSDIIEQNVKKAIASEKLKVDLVTNVSHDLKTPLTAIIGYSELLKKEESFDKSHEYIDKILYKANYLHEIILDIFELSKATSGNLALEKSNIDVKRLIEQTLGSINDDILRSGLEIRRKYVDQDTIVYTDGIRMNKVFQNLIENALKYSLKGTRIYIIIEICNDNICISIANTSSYEMNFTADNIVERFKRGENSRSGEGSGVGLAIAKTYTEACGGCFDLEIIGDLFKVNIVFPELKDN